MAIRVVRLGSDRNKGEGLRIGTVRRPPRGIRKAEYAAKNYYDLWLPALSPSRDAGALGPPGARLEALCQAIPQGNGRAVGAGAA